MGARRKDWTHTPDYFARLRDGTGVVIDVRDNDRIEPEDEGALNLRWLVGYRHPRCMDAGRADSLRQAFREPLQLLEGARRVGDPIAVLPTHYHLLWTHV